MEETSTPKKTVPVEPKRKKVPLKQGYTLGAWVQLVRSGKRSQGTQLITEEELGQHNTEDDIWLSLKGNVYNVTPYMDYHPGGPKMLMAVAGKDATDLFCKYHSWVNEEFLLSNCLIGRLVKDNNDI